MNERIKEFRFKAAEYANEQKPLGITKWNEVRDAKFAELIMRECMRLVDGYTYPVQAQSHTIYHIASETIKQHFGIEA